MGCTALNRVYCPIAEMSGNGVPFDSSTTVFCQQGHPYIALADEKDLPVVVLPESLTLPSQIKIIEEEAFSGIEAQWIVVPDGCQTIEARAFASCPSLNFITLPDSVAHIAVDAFADLEDVTIICPPGSEAARFAQRHGFDWLAG